MKKISGLVFWVSMPIGVLSFLLPIYGLQMNSTAIEIGFFYTVFSLSLVLTRPIFGALIDRWGRKPFLLIGAVFFAFSMFLFSFSNNQMMLFLARGAQGIGAASLWLAVRTMVADTVSANTRGKQFGRIDQASGQGAIFGTTIGFLIIDFLGLHSGWKYVFLIYGIIGIGTIFYIWRNIPDTNYRSRLYTAPQIKWKRSFLVVLWVVFITAVSWSMLSPVIMIYLSNQLNTGAMELAIAYIPASLVWAFLPAKFGKWSDRMGRKNLMMSGMILAGIGSIVITKVHTLTGIAVLWAFLALCFVAGDPAESALVADLTGNWHVGRAYGYYLMAGSLGAAIGPLIGGWLYEVFSPSTPFFANGLVLVINAILFMILMPMEKRQSPKMLDPILK